MATRTTDLETLARALVEDLGALRRLLRRRVRAVMDVPALPGGQVELLRLVESEPGIRVGDAARALRLAPNTVSTLVRELRRSGLLDTSQDAADGRVVCLSLTEAARARLGRWRDERSQVLTAALAELAESDRRALEAGQAGLRALIARLEESA